MAVVSKYDQYGVYLGYNNQVEGWQFPLNPESISVDEGSDGQTYNIVGTVTGSAGKSGEVNVIKGPKLRTISFSGIFPGTDLPFLSAYRFEPKKYIDDIERWMATRRPVRFIFIGHFGSTTNHRLGVEKYYDLNIAASIESFSWKESGGAPGDIEYSITLKEYVFYSAKKVKLASLATGGGATTSRQTVVKTPPTRPNESVRPKTYTIKPGDTLSKISQMVLGDSSRWREIQQLNGLSDADLRKLKIGAILKIPQGGKRSAPVVTPKSKTSSRGGTAWKAAAKVTGGANWAESGGLARKTGFSGALEMDDELGGAGGVSAGGYSHSGSVGGW